MPLFNFKCTGCGIKSRRILKPGEVDTLLDTPCQCGSKWQRDPTGPTKQVMERLDNGIMPRAVERLSEAERLYKERSKKTEE